MEYFISDYLKNKITRRVSNRMGNELPTLLAILISRNHNKNPIVIRVDSVTGTYVNINNPNGLPDVIKPTNIFMIDSTKSPKIVPVNPDKGL